MVVSAKGLQEADGYVYGAELGERSNSQIWSSVVVRECEIVIAASCCDVRCVMCLPTAKLSNLLPRTASIQILELNCVHHV